MAIPSFFNDSYGLALMRRVSGGSEWFFVDWLFSNGHIYDNPGVGTWEYQIWMVIGTGAAVAGTSVASVEHGTTTSARCNIVAQNMRR